VVVWNGRGSALALQGRYVMEELGLDPSPETVALYQQILCMEKRPRYDDFGLNGNR